MTASRNRQKRAKERERNKRTMTLQIKRPSHGGRERELWKEEENKSTIRQIGLQHIPAHVEEKPTSNIGTTTAPTTAKTTITTNWSN